MPAIKRSYDEANGEATQASPLISVRNLWQFANLVQWIYIFGKAAKIDDGIDVEVIENEALKSNSTILQDVALALVKMASSFRGITYDGLDDQLRKLYRLHAPDSNPFGEEDAPVPFETLDSLVKVRTIRKTMLSAVSLGLTKKCKIRVLQQLTQWVMIHPERFRDKMEEQKDSEQTSWRIEPYGWDSEDRTYFVLDDNRLYRLTDPPPPLPPAKKPKKVKTYRKGRRSSRRQQVTNASSHDDAAESSQREEEGMQGDQTALAGDETLGGMIWECVAVTLSEVERFLDDIERSRDENEKILRNQIRDHLLPILRKQEESRKRREQQRERELLNQAKMANAKRSSRIAGRIEQQKHDEELKKQEADKRLAEATERREEMERLKKEQERDFRMASREERLKEREIRRRRHEEELAQLSEDSRNLSDRPGRLSERRLQADIERNQQALKELEEEEEDWIFDCTCGLYGRIDDGEHSIACERCNIWQHSKCIGVKEEEAEKPDFHFVCPRCTKREHDAQARDRPTIKIKLHNSVAQPSSSASNPPSSLVVEIPAKPHSPETVDTGHPLQAGHVPVSEKGDEKAATRARSDAEQSGLGTLEPGLSGEHASYENSSTPGPLVTHDRLSQDHRGTNPSPSKTFANGHTTGEISTPLADSRGGDRESGMGSIPIFATPSLGGALHRNTEDSNGLHSSPGGLSPTKSSPHLSTTAATSEVARARLTLSPMTSLAPAASHQDPTPPVKPLDNRGSFSSPEQYTKNLPS